MAAEAATAATADTTADTALTATTAAIATPLKGFVLPSIKGEAPSLAEPLLRSNVGGIHNALAWLHNVATQLSAALGEQQDRLDRSSEESFQDRRQLSERLTALEAQVCSFNAFGSRACSARGDRILTSMSNASPVFGPSPEATGRFGSQHLAASPSESGSPKDLARPNSSKEDERQQQQHQEEEEEQAQQAAQGPNEQELQQAMRALVIRTPSETGRRGVEAESVAGTIPTSARALQPKSTTAFSQASGWGTGDLVGRSPSHFGDLRPILDRNQQLEQRLDRLEQQQSQQQASHSEALGLRLEALEMELAALAKKSRDGERSEISDWKAKLEREIPESIAKLGQELREELRARSEELRGSFEATLADVRGAWEEDDEVDHQHEATIDDEAKLEADQNNAASSRPQDASLVSGIGDVELANDQANRDRTGSSSPGPEAVGGRPSQGSVTSALSRDSRGRSGPRSRNSPPGSPGSSRHGGKAAFDSSIEQRLARLEEAFAARLSGGPGSSSSSPSPRQQPRSKTGSLELKSLVEDVRQSQDARLSELSEELDRLRSTVVQDSDVASRLADLSSVVEQLRGRVAELNAGGGGGKEGRQENLDGSPTSQARLPRRSLDSLDAVTSQTSTSLPPPASAVVAAAAAAEKFAATEGPLGGGGGGGVGGGGADGDVGDGAEELGEQKASAGQGAEAGTTPGIAAAATDDVHTVAASASLASASTAQADAPNTEVSKNAAAPGKPAEVDSQDKGLIEMQVRSLARELQSLRDAVEQRSATMSLAAELNSMMQAMPNQDGPLPTVDENFGTDGESAALAAASAGGGGLGSHPWAREVERRLVALEKAPASTSTTGGSGGGGGKRRGSGTSPGKSASKPAKGGDSSSGGNATNTSGEPGVAQKPNSSEEKGKGEADKPSGVAAGIPSIVVSQPEHEQRRASDVQSEVFSTMGSEDGDFGALAFGSGRRGSGGSELASAANVNVNGEGGEEAKKISKLEAKMLSLSLEVNNLKDSHRDLLARQAVAASMRGSDVDSESLLGDGMMSAVPSRLSSKNGPGPQLSARGEAGKQRGSTTQTLSPLPSSKAGTSNNSKQAAFMKDLSHKVDKMQNTLEGICCGTVNVINEQTLNELDGRAESRLTSAWKDLRKLAGEAAVRANQVEQFLNTRLAKVESTVGEMAARKKTEKELADQLLEVKKLLEWLTWRISWLEWATKGEERGFGRPLDHKALMVTAPPPETPAATAFSQPLTEDIELWARADNRLRPRRPLPMTLVGHGALTSSPPPPEANLRMSRSQPRLPSIAS